MSRQIVKKNIPVGGVWAYTRGQTIDSAAVDANGWQEYVVGENTKEGREIKAEVTGRNPGDFDTKTPAAARPSATSSKQEG